MSESVYYKNSPILHSLALVAAGDERGELVEEIDFRRSITSLLGSNTKPKKSALPIKAVLKLVQLFLNLEDRATRFVISPAVKRQADFYTFSFPTYVGNTLGPVIPKLKDLVENETNGEAKAAVLRLIQMLEEGNVTAQSALYLELIDAYYDAYPDKGASDHRLHVVDERTRVLAFVLMAINPIVRDYEPQNLTKQVLEDLAAFGLMPFVHLHSYLIDFNTAYEVGKDTISETYGYKNRPEVSEYGLAQVSQKRDEWKRRIEQFEAERLMVADLASGLKQRIDAQSEGADALVEAAKEKLFSQIAHDIFGREWYLNTIGGARTEFEDSLHRHFSRFSSSKKDRLIDLVRALLVLIEYVEDGNWDDEPLLMTVSQKLYDFIVGIYGVGPGDKYVRVYAGV